ncbi:MAG: NADH-quinone oxidoreductase subunit A, partial [Candidatus Latescibacteria bacterium]|nr:NADH-quinone oxidoreductase subunit A [Candidatus Latescibacterota bacterium]
MNGELQQFVPIGLLVIVAVAFVGAIVFLPSLLAKKRSFNRLKDTPYECGIPA